MRGVDSHAPNVPKADDCEQDGQDPARACWRFASAVVEFQQFGHGY